MSFKIAVWSGKKKVNKQEALAVYERILQGNCEDLQESDNIEHFLKELAKEIPSYENIPEDKRANGPWEEPFTVSDSYVLLSLRRERCVEAVPIILKMATKSDLTYYDPQHQVVYNPNAILSWMRKMAATVMP